uniref:E3_UBR4_N domain-containing protein n=1 Tax=Schistocephalus solidus TaxID=70667 RepID=A0A183TBL4_SCHSO
LDLYYALRALVGGVEPFPAALVATCNAMHQYVDEKDVDTTLQPEAVVPQTTNTKAKMRKAPIAMELWSDVTSSLSLSPTTATTGTAVGAQNGKLTDIQSVARATFWRKNGNEVLLRILQGLISEAKMSAPFDCIDIENKAILLNEILTGALSLSTEAKVRLTLNTLPPTFASSWIKETLSLIVTLTETLAPIIFSRTSPETDKLHSSVTPLMVLQSSIVLEKLVELHGAFSTLFSNEAGKVDYFELDAAEVWLGLRILAAFAATDASDIEKLAVVAEQSNTRELWQRARSATDPAGSKPAPCLRGLMSLSLLTFSLLESGLKNTSMFGNLPWATSPSSSQPRDALQAVQRKLSRSEWRNLLSLVTCFNVSQARLNNVGSSHSLAGCYFYPRQQPKVRTTSNVTHFDCLLFVVAEDTYEKFVSDSPTRSCLVASDAVPILILDFVCTLFTSAIGLQVDSERDPPRDAPSLLSRVTESTKKAITCLGELLQLSLQSPSIPPNPRFDNAELSILLANLVCLIDSSLLSAAPKSGSRSGLAADLTQPLTALFFFLANLDDASVVESASRTCLRTALTHIGLFPTLVAEQKPSTSNLSPGPLSFRLLTAYMLALSRNDTNNEIETFCSRLIEHLAELGNNGSASSPCDLSCEMAELVSLLSAGFPSLAYKKAFLQNLTNAFLALAATSSTDVLPDEAIGNAPGLLPFLRLLVLFRYQLHYFFDPPKHLNAQLRPLLSGDGSESCLVWEFPDLKRAVEKLPENFKPVEAVGRACFYDLLLPHSTVANDETSDATTTNSLSTTPPADGLALITLISRADYDQVFSSLLHVFDRGLGRVPPPGTRAQSVVEVENARTLAYVYYSFALSWRLLEILPPSPDFVSLLRDRFQRATGVEMVPEPATAEDSPASPNRFIYLVILLDRLRRFATAPYFDLQQRATSLVPLKPPTGSWSFSTTSASKETTVFKPPKTSFSTLSKLKPNVRCVELIAVRRKKNFYFSANVHVPKLCSFARPARHACRAVTHTSKITKHLGKTLR